MKDLLDRFNPGLNARFNIKSILIMVVENTFSEMRAGGSDMPLQLEFDYRFITVVYQRTLEKAMLYSKFILYWHQFMLPSHFCLFKLLRPSKITSSEDKEVN